MCTHVDLLHIFYREVDKIYRLYIDFKYIWIFIFSLSIYTHLIRRRKAAVGVSEFLRFTFSYIYLHAYMCVYECMMCVCQCLQRPEEGIEASETRVSGGCELLSICWKWDWHSLEEQQML